MSLQTRLMTAVIGFVSLILIIVAVITSATLGSTLERQLDEKVESYAGGITKLVQQVPAERATVDNILKGGNPQIPGLLFAVASPVTGATGIAFDNSNGDLGGTSQALTAEQLHELISALGSGTPATVSLTGLGSYRIVANPASTGVVVITGLPVTRSRTSSRSYSPSSPSRPSEGSSCWR